MRDRKKLPRFRFPGSGEPHFRLRRDPIRTVEIKVDCSGGSFGGIVADPVKERSTDEQVLESVAVDVSCCQRVAETGR